MRVRTLAIAALCFVVLGGCTTARHAFQPFGAAGADLPIEVAVNYKDGDHVRGTVHHRRNGRGTFVATPMTLRADQLYTILPTDDTNPDDVLEYYIDVSRNGKLHPLGTPGHPYVVTFLDGDQMVLTQLQDKPFHTDAHHDVRIALLTSGQTIAQPAAVYQMPGVPGDIRTDMESDEHGNFHVVVPASTVTPGTWRYAIEVPVNGKVYRFPERGFRTFIVEQGYPPKIATGAVK